jgi:DICT domain-containing protein
MSSIAPDLPISAVAAATGVTIPSLRSWELRFGFPEPERLPSGHRRYSALQVQQIRQVLADREAGLSLEAAISRVQATSERVERSIFAGLRRRWPELPAHVLSKRAMLAISRAIEDECCAQADRPVLIGTFQEERFYRQSEARWRELARTAELAIAFGDFRRDRLSPRGVVELALAHDAPLRREWAVVCDAPNAAACLAGFERPGHRGADRERRFEAVWSVDPVIVRDAAEIAVGLASVLPSGICPPLDHRPFSDAAANLRRASALTNRIVADLDI